MKIFNIEFLKKFSRENSKIGTVEHKYLTLDRIENTDFADSKINELYSHGYVATRIARGTMDQTRSLRIDLSKFEFSSENRRILRKNESLNLNVRTLPIDKENYDWQIHKIGKDFYSTKFGDETFSANKIKELLTTSHNFSHLFEYSRGNEVVGYCIVITTDKILHYCYPFYRLDIDTNNLGMGMMLKAIEYAKTSCKEYIYLGSVQRESDKYKLQFKGLEVWNNTSNKWVKQS